MLRRDQGFLTSVQHDASKAGVGTSPFVGEMAASGIRVPQWATTAQNRRYLFRLASLKVPAKVTCYLQNIHQLLYIGAELQSEHGKEDEKWLLEIPVVDPLWSFPDGNVSWHLRSFDIGTPDTRIYTDFIFPPDTATRADTTDSALLARQPALGPGTYLPLNGGMPYGKSAIAGLGTWRDMRFPWKHDGPNLGIEIRGPVALVLYASVYQTDPSRRPNKPVLIETAGLRAEDLFMLNYPTARYTRVGGRIMFDMVEDKE